MEIEWKSLYNKSSCGKCSTLHHCSLLFLHTIFIFHIGARTVEHAFLPVQFLSPHRRKNGIGAKSLGNFLLRIHSLAYVRIHKGETIKMAALWKIIP